MVATATQNTAPVGTPAIIWKVKLPDPSVPKNPPFTIAGGSVKDTLEDNDDGDFNELSNFEFGNV